jgi:hypothetical protein
MEATRNEGSVMKQDDFEKFREGLAGVYGFYDKEINSFALDVWWNALKIYDLTAITQAFNRHVVNTEAGKWLPKPADIIRMLQGSTLDAAMSAWAKVDKALRHKGIYSDVVFDDPLIHRVLHDMGGWISLGYKTDDEWPFVAREFENRYRGFKERNEIPEYPTELVGVANSYNSSKGLPLEPVVYVGDVEKCKRVKAGGINKPLVAFKKIDQEVPNLTIAIDKKTVNEK